MQSPRVEEVSDGVYAYIQPDGSWYINNTGFLVGGGGVISIDACATRQRTRALLAAIASVTDLPVRTLINTHHHGDHTYGNYLFGGATIVAHERCRAGVLASGLPANLGVWTDVDWGIPELAPPFLTYADAVTVWSGDLKCDVRYVGMPAHTTNDSLIWLPERSVLFAGDLAFSGGYAGLLDSERIVGNLHRAYAELAGAPRGAEIDLIAALTDMISYNGGRPLTCHA
jgi:cyclase